MSKKIRILLLVSFTVFGLSLLGILLYFINQNNALVTTDASTLGSICAVTSDCDAGLVCVNFSGTTKQCSKLEDGQYCDKTSKLCANGLTCVMYTTAGEFYRCTSGSNGTPCVNDASCKTGLKCVEKGNTDKYCSDLKLSSFCDKNLKSCDVGLKCITNVTTGENFRCTNGDNGYQCGNDADCDTGLKCVAINGHNKFCTNYNENSYCDSVAKFCNPGLECVITSGAGKCVKSATANTGVACGSIDSNADKKVDIIDFAKFASIYGKTCKI